MRKHLALAVAACIGLSACTMGAMSSDEINSLDANCSNVSERIAMLKQEQKDNDNRTAAGVGNFVPVTAMARFLTGRYKTNSEISTGHWSYLIDNKLRELKEMKAACEQAEQQ